LKKKAHYQYAMPISDHPDLHFWAAIKPILITTQWNSTRKYWSHYLLGQEHAISSYV